MLSAPQFVPLHPDPEIAQVTPRPFGSFCTVAENGCARFTETVCDPGDTETAMAGGGPIITAELADFVLSATDTAVTLTLGGVGVVPGAV